MINSIKDVYENGGSSKQSVMVRELHFVPVCG